MTSIAEVQEQKGPTIHEEHDPVDTFDSVRRDSAAARTLQRTYRGHRARRQLKGLTLDSSTRWIEAVKEAQYRELTTPRPHSFNTQPDGSPTSRNATSGAHQKWRHAAKIASRAAGDDGDISSSSSSSVSDEKSKAQKEARRRKRWEEKQERIKSAKMMDLQYFLEMIDVKHRYGSNLRKYHAEWKNSDSHENFFYWLDYGGGKDISLENCPRERLDREQVRYLSREERMNYLVIADQEGRLCWKRNGIRIDTTTEWRDSVNGIVPVEDETPEFSPRDSTRPDDLSSGRSSNDSSIEGGRDGVDGDSANEDLTGARRFKKSKQIGPAAMFEHLLMKPTMKKSKWIFVADTSNNLYIGMKQKGTFQHSSFLHGSRISAAGLIKIKAGQIRSIQPTSGHYRPPASNFRAFIRNLKARDVDLTHINIPKSYALLYGVEGYGRIKGKKKKMVEGLNKAIHPGESKRKEEEQRDKSQSAEKERQAIERQGKKGKRESVGEKLGDKMARVLTLGKAKGDGGA